MIIKVRMDTIIMTNGMLQLIAAEKYILWCSIDSQENYYLMKRTDGRFG
jgi:hypothetical protein